MKVQNAYFFGEKTVSRAPASPPLDIRGRGRTTMVDVRSSAMIKPCMIGSPPPSVLRERSKLRSRLAQSRLTASQPTEETVLPSTGETPAIHLSCSDDTELDDECFQFEDLRSSGSIESLTTEKNGTEARSNSLTPPPRLVPYNPANPTNP